MKRVWGFCLVETLLSSTEWQKRYATLYCIGTSFECVLSIPSMAIMRYLTLQIFNVYLSHIFCISFSYHAYFKIAWERIDRMLVLSRWSLAPVNFHVHAYLFKNMWKQAKENEDNLCPFLPIYLPESTYVWARSLLKSLMVYLKLVFLPFLVF